MFCRRYHKLESFISSDLGRAGIEAAVDAVRRYVGGDAILQGGGVATRFTYFAFDPFLFNPLSSIVSLG
jgi:hypothetical protein